MEFSAKDFFEKCVYVEDLNMYEYEQCHYETIADVVQSKIFGFCGCGSLEQNLQYIRDGLSYIDFRMQNHKEVVKLSYEQLQEQAVKVFGNKKSAYFFYYWCDTQDLTEHGGAVPGWLSEKGIEMLKILQSLKLE